MRALYIGYTENSENHGDEALMWIIRDLLAPEVVVEFAGDPREFDVALLGGGTLINQSPWIIEWFRDAIDQTRTGRGLVFGTGVGDLEFWGDTFDRWVPLLERCDLVGVRGPDSLVLLREHGFDRAVICGDPYLWLRAPVERRRPVAKRMCVNVGNTNNALLGGGTDRELFESVAAALERLAAEGWTFSVFGMWSKGIDFGAELCERLGSACARPVLDARTQTLEVYSALAASELLLGEKLHANAMAVVAGVPFVALEYQPKVRDFARSIEMDAWTVSTADATSELLVLEVEELRRARREVSREMIRAREKLRRELLRFADEVKAFAKAFDKKTRKKVRARA